jgi:hypothetical protein
VPHIVRHPYFPKILSFPSRADISSILHIVRRKDTNRIPTEIMPSRSSLRKQLLLFCSVSLLGYVTANTPTLCYVIDGEHNLNAGYRCDNGTTGHSTCCAAGATCYSNGLCVQMNGQVQDFLRVGCTDPTWQDPACLDKCTNCMFSKMHSVPCGY